MPYVNFQNNLSKCNDTNLNNMQDLIKADIDSVAVSDSIDGITYTKHNNGNYEEYGKATIDSIPAGSGIDITIELKNTLVNADFIVLCTFGDTVGYWGDARLSAFPISNNSFKIAFWNVATAPVENMSINWIVKGKWK